MRLVLLGDPVEHSLSPAIQRAALDSTSLPGTYAARRVDEEGLRNAVEEIRRGDLDGANVTMPHKRAAADLCDRLTGDAGRAGAANTLVRVDGAVIGHNTDLAGIRDAWHARGLPGDVPVLVLGAGGAAAAALLALEDRRLSVSARRAGAGAGLAGRLGVDAREHPWGHGLPGAAVVNATPIGMHAEKLPDGVVTDACAILDMAYGPTETPAVRLLRSRGLPVADGADMLLAQAAASFRIWTGRSPDPDAMRRALENRLGEMRGGAAGAT